jgi:hypothetical protein
LTEREFVREEDGEVHAVTNSHWRMVLAHALFKTEAVVALRTNLDSKQLSPGEGGGRVAI